MFKDDEKLYKIEPLKNIVLRCKNSFIFEKSIKCDLFDGIRFFLDNNNVYIFNNIIKKQTEVKFSENVSFEVKLFFIKMYIKNTLRSNIGSHEKLELNSMVIYHGGGYFQFVIENDIIKDIAYYNLWHDYRGEHDIKKKIFMSS